MLKLVHRSPVFTQQAHPSRCSRSTLTTVCFCARASLVITSGLRVCAGAAVPFILQWSVWIHGQWNTNPANLQCCCTTEAETGFVSNICAVLRRRHFLDTEVSILDSFLYPEVPRVNVHRSLSCSQSIRQRIHRRTVTLYFKSSLEFPDLCT